MKKIFLREIKEKDKIEDVFLVTKKEMGVSKNGKPYLNLKLMDKSGEIEARVWDNAEACSRGFDRNDYVKIKAGVIAYQGGLQLNVAGVLKVNDADVDAKDFLPASTRNADEMLLELDRIIAGIKDKHINKLLKYLMEDTDVRRLFRTAPAAKSIHHPYLGGLLEHVLSLCALSDAVTRHYKNINRDLLLAGVILHDIGKIYELTYDRSFDYSDAGRLLGHITIGISMLDKKIESIHGFPTDLAMLLKHMILSHHGQLEFGSPKRPKTVEALILSYLDDMDSKVYAMQSLIEKETNTESRWTGYQKLFERYIYKESYREQYDAPDDRPGIELDLFKK